MESARAEKESKNESVHAAAGPARQMCGTGGARPGPCLQTAGNMAVQALLAPRTGERRVQKKCKACASGGPPCAKCGGEHHRESVEAPPRLATSGQALSAAMRSYFEPRFGADLGRVRVHTDESAERSAARMGARAFTLGEDIAFAEGEYRPEAPEGRFLVAHELAHALQQGGESSRVRQCGHDDDALEREADEAAEAITKGTEPVALSRSAAGPQRDEAEHSDESYTAFVGRVWARAVSRLEKNIVSLDEWRDYVNAMTEFQMKSQLLAGVVDEYAARAVELPGALPRFERLMGSEDYGVRAYDEFRLARDASYKEGVQALKSRLTTGLQGYWSTPSIAQRMQVEAGDIQEPDLPAPTWHGPSQAFQYYDTEAIRKWVETGEGSCQTCHDITYAWGKTNDEFGDPLPVGMGSRYEKLTQGPFLMADKSGNATPLAFPIKPGEIDAWMRLADSPPAPSTETATPAKAAAPAETTSVQANPFVPAVEIPKGVEAPMPRTDLCGPLPPEEAVDYRTQAASAGPNAAIAMSVVSRIGAVLTPLGPRGYRILPRRTFDHLWGATLEQIADIRTEVLENLDARQEGYRKLIALIQFGQVPYEELCPIVDELLPTTNDSVRALVTWEIEAHRAAEAFLDTVLAIAGVAMLFMAVLFPPSIMLTAPMLAAGGALSLAGLATGARDYRRGQQYGLGVGAGIYTRAQEDAAEGLRFWGMFNMITSALGVFGALRGAKAPEAAGARAVSEGIPIGTLPGTQISQISADTRVLWHPDFPEEIGYLDTDGLTRYRIVGDQMEELDYWPASQIQSAGGGTPGSPLSTAGLTALPEPSTALTVAEPEFVLGGVSNRTGSMPQSPFNPCGLATNCPFTSISGGFYLRDPAAPIRNADELYIETLQDLGLDTSTPHDPVTRMVAFPYKPQPPAGPPPLIYEALGNRWTEYNITSVAMARGLSVRETSTVLNDYSAAFGKPLNQLVTDRLNVLRKAAEATGGKVASRAAIQQSIVNMRQKVAGHYIIGSRTASPTAEAGHFMNMSIDANGVITGNDFQSGAVYNGLNAIRQVLGEIDTILKIDPVAP